MIRPFDIKGNDNLDLSSGKVDMQDFYNSLLVPITNSLEKQPEIDNVARADKSVRDAEQDSVQFDMDEESSNSRSSMSTLGRDIDNQLGNTQANNDLFLNRSIKEGEPLKLNKGIKLSNYGYASDSTPDSFSTRGIGHANNRLVSGRSVAITKRLADKLGIQRGAVLEIDTTKGKRLVTYDDTVPSYDKRTGSLPDTIDIYRKNGSNKWGGKVNGVKLVRQGKKGIAGKRYNQFVEQNFKLATGGN